MTFHSWLNPGLLVVLIDRIRISGGECWVNEFPEVPNVCCAESERRRCVER